MTYLYECKSCGEVEVEQRISDAPLKCCTLCGRRGFRRLIAPGAQFALRGPGWSACGYGFDPDWIDRGV